MKSPKSKFFLRLCAGLALVLALHGCATRPSVPPLTAPGIPLKDLCTRYNVSWQWDGVTQVIILEYKNNKAKALVGSNVVVLGKERVELSSPLRRANSTIYVPEDFETKVLVPFGIMPGISGLQVDWARLRIHTVVLDAGHGGKDPGAQSPGGVKEKTVVLDIARRMKDLLEQVGIKVIMTRTRDEFISLPQRTEIASKSDAELYVSIHANANPSRKAQGMEVYYVKTHRKKDLDEEQRQKNERLFVRQLSMKSSPQLTKVVADMMYTLKIAESKKLAQNIVQQASVDVDTPNRGTHPCRFFVVRNTLIPAVLVEVGYLTNRREEQQLNSPVYRQKVAQALARSIIHYATAN